MQGEEPRLGGLSASPGTLSQQIPGQTPLSPHGLSSSVCVQTLPDPAAVTFLQQSPSWAFLHGPGPGTKQSARAFSVKDTNKQWDEEKANIARLHLNPIKL